MCHRNNDQYAAQSLPDFVDAPYIVLCIYK